MGAAVERIFSTKQYRLNSSSKREGFSMFNKTIGKVVQGKMVNSSGHLYFLIVDYLHLKRKKWDQLN
jgi:hypothetical protein